MRRDSFPTTTDHGRSRGDSNLSEQDHNQTKNVDDIFSSANHSLRNKGFENNNNNEGSGSNGSGNVNEKKGNFGSMWKQCKEAAAGSQKSNMTSIAAAVIDGDVGVAKVGNKNEVTSNDNNNNNHNHNDRDDTDVPSFQLTPPGSPPTTARSYRSNSSAVVLGDEIHPIVIPTPLSLIFPL